MIPGRIVAAGIVGSALVAGAAIYYLQVYAFYREVPAGAAEARVALTSVVSGVPEAIVAEDFQAIDADSSPLRYRACFRTASSLAMLTETYVIADDAVPLVGPAWFACYDAARIGAALKAGEAVAFVGQRDIRDGVDRIVAVFPDGSAFAWNQLNEKYKD